MKKWGKKLEDKQIKIIFFFLLESRLDGIGQWLLTGLLRVAELQKVAESDLDVQLKNYMYFSRIKAQRKEAQLQM